MADDRTTEQREADEALREAVDRAAKAYADDDTAGWLLSEYLVVYSRQGWDDDGDACTEVGTALDGTTPVHRLLGLAEYASARYRKIAWHDLDIDG